MTLELLAEAEADADEAFFWYLERERAVAARFLKALDRTLARIAKVPLQNPMIDRRHRASRLTKFPYKVVFRVDEDRVTVIAVAHDRRNPTYWLDRSKA